MRAAVGVVEVGGALARKLQVLPLVLAHGDMSRTVDKDVRGLQDRVGEEPVLERSLGPFVQDRGILG